MEAAVLYTRCFTVLASMIPSMIVFPRSSSVGALSSRKHCEGINQLWNSLGMDGNPRAKASHRVIGVGVDEGRPRASKGGRNLLSIPPIRLDDFSPEFPEFLGCVRGRIPGDSNYSEALVLEKRSSHGATLRPGSSEHGHGFGDWRASHCGGLYQ